MLIRRALAEDAYDIALVHVSSWQHAYRGVVPQAYLDQLSVADRQSRWMELLERGGSEILVAEAEGHIVGFISFGASRQKQAEPDEGELFAIYVGPSHWSRGVGRSLWEAALGNLRNLGFIRAIVWVLVANARAIRFYERAGFTLCPASETAIEIGGKRLHEVRYGITIA